MAFRFGYTKPESGNYKRIDWNECYLVTAQMHGKKRVLNCLIRHPLLAPDTEPKITKINPFNFSKFKQLVDIPGLIVIYSHFYSFVYLSGECKNLEQQIAIRPFETLTKASDCSSVQMEALLSVVAKDRDVYITMLPTYNHIIKHNTTDPNAECPVCYTNLFENPNLCITTKLCKHKFCTQCISNWLKTEDTCPYCRQKIDM